ncbi:hypothetical protein D3C73_874840 [compost metagenome]
MEANPGASLLGTDCKIVPLPILSRHASNGLKPPMDVKSGVLVHGQKLKSEFERCWIGLGFNLGNHLLIPRTSQSGQYAFGSALARMPLPPDSHGGVEVDRI